MVKEIKPLNSDKLMKVDDEDYEELSKHKWWFNNKGYPHTYIYVDNKRTSIFMHQILIKPPKGLQIDHIDRDKLNNQRDNLRIATQSQNNMNRIKQKNTSSKYKGVSWHKEHKKWRAYITFKDKYIHLGYFTNEDDAGRAYNKRAKELFNKYANLNIIMEF